jgi:hypothetical protein
MTQPEWTPEVDQSGAYRPISLLAWLDEAESLGLGAWQIARALKVPQDRILYFQKEGRPFLERKAKMEKAA